MLGISVVEFFGFGLEVYDISIVVYSKFGRRDWEKMEKSTKKVFQINFTRTASNDKSYIFI